MSVVEYDTLVTSRNRNHGNIVELARERERNVCSVTNILNIYTPRVNSVREIFF